MSDFDLEGDDVAIFTRFAKRAGLNLKVTPEFHERVGALARNEGITMVDLVERAVEAFARTRKTETS
jgi:hypothetical protein